MLHYIEDNKGLQLDIINSSMEPLRIGLIDADLLDHGTKHPNLALLKISGYCKQIKLKDGRSHIVRLICSYSELQAGEMFHDNDYDILIISRVFKFTRLPKDIQGLIDNHLAYYGGTGFFEINGPTLPDDVEHHMPDYHLYDEYINNQTGGDEAKKDKDWKDYLNYSIGFTTRGCIRHCGFCVNRLLNRVQRWSPVSEFLDRSRKGIYLWDDNIMAAPPRVFSSVLTELINTGLPFQFRQGLDIRLMTEEKARILSQANYHGDYIFAFDHYRMDDPNEKNQVEQTIRGLTIWREFCDKSTKLYVLVAYDGIDEKDIEGAFYRIKVLMEFGCIPYIMRFEQYKESPFMDLYTQLARWCNQPSIFKKMSFRQFCVRNEEYHQGIKDLTPSGTYNTKLSIPDGLMRKKRFGRCYQTMIDFERDYPSIAKTYFDLRFEDINQYRFR